MWDKFARFEKIKYMADCNFCKLFATHSFTNFSKKQTYLEKLDINDVASIFPSKDARTFSFHFEFHSISSPFQCLNCYAMANINHIYIIYRQNNIVDPKPEIWNQLLMNFEICTSQFWIFDFSHVILTLNIFESGPKPTPWKYLLKRGTFLETSYELK